MNMKILCSILIMIVAAADICIMTDRLFSPHKQTKKRIFISVITAFLLMILWTWMIFMHSHKWIAVVLSIVYLLMFIARFLGFLAFCDKYNSTKEEDVWRKNAGFVLTKVRDIKNTVHLYDIKMSKECIAKLDNLYDIYAEKRISYQTSLKIKEVIQKFVVVLDEYKNLQHRLSADEEYFAEALLDFEDFIFKIEEFEITKESTAFCEAVADMQSQIHK